MPEERSWRDILTNPRGWWDRLITPGERESWWEILHKVGLGTTGTISSLVTLSNFPPSSPIELIAGTLGTGVGPLLALSGIGRAVKKGKFKPYKKLKDKLRGRFKPFKPYKKLDLNSSLLDIDHGWKSRLLGNQEIKEIKYITNPGPHSKGKELNPEELEENCWYDFLELCKNHTEKPKNEKKLNVIEKVLRGESDGLEAYIQSNLGSLYAPQRKKFKRSEDPDLEQIVEEDLIMYSDAKMQQNPAKGFETKKDRYQVFLNKFDPGFFDVNESCTLELTTDEKEMKKAGQKLDTCLPFEDCEDFAQDIGTFFWTLRDKEDNIKGYRRDFVYEGKDGSPVLAVDTLEPPKKHFEDHIGKLKTMFMGAIKFARDLGFDRVLIKDARGKYIRKGISQRECRYDMEKIGEKGEGSLFSYRFSPYAIEGRALGLEVPG